jgi:long-chain fatty acid transport protein
MKKWFNPVLLVALTLGMTVPAFGGGIDNKQNFSAAYAGSLSRNGATDGADVAAYNPAGLTMLDNGFHLEVDAQPFTFDYDHTYNGETHTASPTLLAPTAFAVHKSDNWAIWGAFTINGGGGETEYENGNIITEGIGNALPGAGGSLKNQYAYAESYDYTFTTGAAYRINNIFSVAGGIRYIITDKEVDIHGDYNGKYIAGKYDQEADGFGGIFGLNIHPIDTVNIGIRYETRVNLDWKTDTSKSTTFGKALLNAYDRVDGQSYARDLPAVLGLGLEWKVRPNLTLKPSYSLYFEKDADWDTQNDAVNGNSYEMALAVQYDINQAWSITTGYMFIDVDMKPENFGIIEQMSPPLDCHAVALGTRYKYNERLTLTFGLTGYFYVSDTAPAMTTTTTTTPEVTYDKTLYQAGIGLQYKFF